MSDFAISFVNCLKSSLSVFFSNISSISLILNLPIDSLYLIFKLQYPMT